MTIKTWKERLPKTKAATAHDRRFAMESEIDDLRAKSAMDDAMLAGNGALITELRAKLAEHKAARIAYASEFPLDADGEPDVGNIHANIRKLKKDADQAIKLLSLMFDKYDEGVQCYEEPEDCAGFMGNAVELNGDEFSEIVELLDRLAPRDAS